jgi:hypothetical protein
MAANPASAQNRNCADHDKLTERLASGFGESRQVIAMNADSSVLEVFASDETGTWTITVTKAGGLTCIVAAGQHYQHLAEAMPVDDNGA